MKNSIPYLKSASPLSQYHLYVEFEDGVAGVIDLSMWKEKGVFEYWNNEDNFKNFKITASKKIEWNDEIDMDPDAFYLKLIGKTFRSMPTISSFYEIFIKMYFGDHVPPHFHAEYGEFDALFSIKDLGIIEGYLPPKSNWAGCRMGKHTSGRVNEELDKFE